MRLNLPGDHEGYGPHECGNLLIEALGARSLSSGRKDRRIPPYEL